MNLDKLCATENANQKNQKVSLSLQPLTQISIGKTLGNQLGPKLPNLAIWILSGLAVVVIISACFNYTNLSIARSLRRSREVGIRKVIGAMKSHIRGQFISEAVIISFLALIISFVLFLFLRKQFLSLDPFIGNLVSLDLSFTIVFYFIIFALIVGFVGWIFTRVIFLESKCDPGVKRYFLLACVSQRQYTESTDCCSIYFFVDFHHDNDHGIQTVQEFSHV